MMYDFISTQSQTKESPTSMGLKQTIRVAVATFAAKARRGPRSGTCTAMALAAASATIPAIVAGTVPSNMAQVIGQEPAPSGDRLHHQKV